MVAGPDSRTARNAHQDRMMARHLSEETGRPVYERRRLQQYARVLAGACTMLMLLTPGVKAMTGGEWLDRCGIFLAIQAGEPIQVDATTKQTLQTCSVTAATAWCAKSYVVIGAKLNIPAGRQQTVAEALSRVCPHPLTQSHPVRYALEYWKTRELSHTRRQQPAAGMLLEAFKKRWPQCVSTRRRLNALAPPQALAHCIRFHTPDWRL